MYAVVKSGGKQYKVQEGETFRVEKLPGDVGGEITFDDVLMVRGSRLLFAWGCRLYAR